MIEPEDRLIEKKKSLTYVQKDKKIENIEKTERNMEYKEKFRIQGKWNKGHLCVFFKFQKEIRKRMVETSIWEYVD